LAFKFKAGHEKWVKYKSWVRDHVQTLREFDLVNLDEADSSIIEAIERKGIVHMSVKIKNSIEILERPT